MNFDKLTAYLDSLEQKYGVPGADCKITYRHETVFRHGAGYSDYERQKPVSCRDMYRLYSASKVITMIAVLQQMERGNLGLYDYVSTYLPEFTVMRVSDTYRWEEMPPKWPVSGDACHLAHNRIRIIDLMSMTAGLSYDTASKEIRELRERSRNQATTREMMGAIAKMLLISEPGTRYGYSLAHDVLAAVVEVTSGMKFSEYLRQNIFEPVGAKDFCFHPDEEQKKRIAAIYLCDRETKKILPCSQETADGFALSEQYESGGAGLIGTVDAYSAVIDAVCNGGKTAEGKRILSEASVALLQTNYTTGQMLEDFRIAGKKGYGYGLGVRVLIDQSASRSPLGEFGWDGAAGAYVLVDPKNKISIFYAQHIMGHLVSYDMIHPAIRDLTYEAMGF